MSWDLVLENLFSKAAAYLLVAGAVFSCVWAISILTSRKAYVDRCTLAALIFLAGIWQAAGAYWLSGAYRTFPLFMGWQNPALFLLGPVIYRFFQSALLHHKVSWKSMTLHSLPAVFCLLALIPYWSAPPDERIARVAGEIVDRYTSVLFACNVGPKLSILAYLSYVAYLSVRGVAHSPEKSARRILFMKLIIIYASLAAGSAGYFLKNETMIVLSAGSLPLIVFVSFILSEAVPEVFSELGREVRRYERTRLANVVVEDVNERLDRLMRLEKAYTDEDLTLQRLALEVGITPHQLSEFLNRHLGKSFSDYVNEFRVKEAQALLVSEIDRSTLSIAHAAGFNSKSAFYRAFRRLAGMDPTEFRNRGMSRGMIKDAAAGFKS